MKNYPKDTPYMWLSTLMECWIIIRTWPNHTKPNQINLKLRFGQKILTSTTFTPDKFKILGPISGLQEVILDFSIFFQLLGPIWKKFFHGSKLWVKTPLNPKFQNHSDTNAYLRSHFCSNFNWILSFFQGFFGPNLACMWSVCTSAFHICACLSDFCQKWGSYSPKIKLNFSIVILPKFLIPWKIGLFGTP